jgi:hypothetical protein
VRRKRLQHSANILCQMFCGWRLGGSYKDLERLGSGTLSIDALVGSCRFDGVPVEPPHIAGELHAWLCQDLTAQGIPIAALLRAALTARLSITAIGPRQRITLVHFSLANGKRVRWDKFYRCVIECESEVATDEAAYRSRLADVEEWPAGWPGG